MKRTGKKIISFLLTLVLVLSLLPSTALAGRVVRLYVGNTIVYNEEEELNFDTTYYWKAAESGEYDYASTGNADDYLFSVSCDMDGKFTLTLNGVQITNFFSNSNSDYDFGIYSNTDLEIILVEDTINSVVIADSETSESHGIYVSGTLSIKGNASLSVSGGTYGIIAWGGGAELNIEDATINSSGNAYGILVDGPVNIYSGKVYATGLNEYSDGITATGDFSMYGGYVTALGERTAINISNEGLETNILINNYKYRTNTIAEIATSSYTQYPDTAFVNSNDYKYVEINTLYEITETSSENGSFIISGNSTNSTGTAIAAAGDIINLQATPNSGYTFSAWDVYKTGDINTKVTVSGNSFTMPAYPVTISASFTVFNNNNDDDYIPPRTITVTETSSSLFSSANGPIIAKANMQNAFSNSVEVKVTNTNESDSSFMLEIENTVYPFDISLYIKGTNNKTVPRDGYTVTISLPVPETLLNAKEQLSIAHKADDDSVTMLVSELKQINDIWYLVFEAKDFSPYALIVSSKCTYNSELGVPYYIDSNENDVFIGFAANDKFIAPLATKVLFKNNSKSFSDIAKHWAKNNINFVTEREIFLGLESTVFSPDSNMSRAMFATVIGRLYERSFSEIELTGNGAFTDCNYDEYYGKYVDWATKNDIIIGYGNGLFKPNSPISREEMATIIYRFADFLKVLDANLDTELLYPDSVKISNWAVNAALYSQSINLITGRDNGGFVPQATATRAEVSAILERFIKSILD